MGVAKKYMVGKRAFWQVDEWVTLPDGTAQRFRKRKIPTREMAEALAAKVRINGFEGRYFERVKVPTLTVAQVWKLYEPVSRRDNGSWRGEASAAKHVLRHLGRKRAAQLTQDQIDAYTGTSGSMRRRGGARRRHRQRWTKRWSYSNGRSTTR
jgi:hypothetical protein